MKVEFYDCPFCGELGVQTGHGCKEKTDLFKAVKTPKPEETRGMRQITKEEWDQYDWLEVTTPKDRAEGRRVYVKGVKYVEPPNDGCVYIEDTRIGDAEQRWIPAMTYTYDKEE